MDLVKIVNEPRGVDARISEDDTDDHTEPEVDVQVEKHYLTKDILMRSRRQGLDGGKNKIPIGCGHAQFLIDLGVLLQQVIKTAGHPGIVVFG